MCAGVVAVDRRDDEGRLLCDGICSTFLDLRAGTVYARPTPSPSRHIPTRTAAEVGGV